ncbi:MAG TPA: hypothetical protein VEQ60_07345 [Longimicrobium sp.]|nr:hypothetical protein [Longimicrobium sp.]
MTRPEYQPLSREQIELLVAPENGHLQRAWDSLNGALHGLVAVLSDTHPRPLYFYEESDRRRVVEERDRLRGTLFHAAAVANVRAAEEIERMARERGDAPETQRIIDGYVDALLDEFDAIRLYPEFPPRPRVAEASGAADQHRAVAGL